MATLARAAVLLVTSALSVLFACGSLLAALFELQGFGGHADQGPRPLYLASFAVGFALCVAAPFLVGRAYDYIRALAHLEQHLRRALQRLNR